MKEQFDFEQYKAQAVEDLLAGRKEIGGPDGVLAPLLKQFLEAALEAEIENHVQESKAKGHANRRNGLTSKEVRSLSGGAISLKTPRDRDGSFERAPLTLLPSYLLTFLPSYLLSFLPSFLLSFLPSLH